MKKAQKIHYHEVKWLPMPVQYEEDSHVYQFHEVKILDISFPNDHTPKNKLTNAPVEVAVHLLTIRLS